MLQVKWKGIRVRKLPLLTTDIVYYIKGNCLEKIPFLLVQKVSCFAVHPSPITA